MTASASQRAVQASAKKAAKAERKLQEADIGSKRSEMEKQKVRLGDTLVNSTRSRSRAR